MGLVTTTPSFDWAVMCFLHDLLVNRSKVWAGDVHIEVIEGQQIGTDVVATMGGLEIRFTMYKQENGRYAAFGKFTMTIDGASRTMEVVEYINKNASYIFRD